MLVLITIHITPTHYPVWGPKWETARFLSVLQSTKQSFKPPRGPPVRSSSPPHVVPMSVSLQSSSPVLNPYQHRPVTLAHYSLPSPDCLTDQCAIYTIGLLSVTVSPLSYSDYHTIFPSIDISLDWTLLTSTPYRYRILLVSHNLFTTYLPFHAVIPVSYHPIDTTK